MRVDRTLYHDEFQPVDKKLNKSNSRKRYTSFFLFLFLFVCLFVCFFEILTPIYSVERQYNTINMLHDMSGYMYGEHVNMNNIMKARDQGK